MSSKIASNGFKFNFCSLDGSSKRVAGKVPTRLPVMAAGFRVGGLLGGSWVPIGSKVVPFWGCLIGS